MNTFSLDGSSLGNRRLGYGGDVFFPETEYDFKSKVGIYNDLMWYAVQKNKQTNKHKKKKTTTIQPNAVESGKLQLLVPTNLF